jgi:hypothetical protein
MQKGAKLFISKTLTPSLMYVVNCITRGVSHYGLAIYVKKYLKAKEELLKFKYFTMQKYNLQKHSLQETKIL